MEDSLRTSSSGILKEEHNTRYDIDWQIDGLLAKQGSTILPKEEPKLYSSKFGFDKWQLKLDLGGKPEPVLAIIPSATAPECRYTFQVHSLDGTVLLEKTTEACCRQGSLWSAVTIHSHTIRSCDSITVNCQVIVQPSTLRSFSPSNVLRNFFDDPKFSDVMFIFPRSENEISDQRIFASKIILSSQSEYFRAMFNSGFSEGSPKSAKPEIEVNLLDDLEYEEQSFNGEASPVFIGQEVSSHMIVIIVRDFSHRTYSAMVKYLYTDDISFDTRLSHPAMQLEPRSKMSNSAYPKQIYRLADKLDLENLKEIAKNRILLNLTPWNVGLQVLGTFAETFDEIKKAEFGFLQANWSLVGATEEWDRALELIANDGGATPHLKATLKEIIENVAKASFNIFAVRRKKIHDHN